jgi:hypothetical protein
MAIEGMREMREAAETALSNWTDDVVIGSYKD